MKKATLIYEPALQAYALKFDYNAEILAFLKKLIPSHKRTSSGPPDWIWYFGSEYYDFVRQLFEGHRAYNLRVVTEDEVRKLQEQQEQASQHTYIPTERSYSLEEEIKKFYNLLNYTDRLYTVPSLDKVRNASQAEASKFYRKAAFKYHPDRNSGSWESEEKTRQLNEVWTLLKEVYYTK